MKEEIDKFLEFLNLEGDSDHTIRSYKRDLTDFSEFLSDKPVNEVNKKDARNFLGSLTRYGYDHRSTARKLSALRTFFKFLLRNNMITNDPVAELKAPKLEQKVPSFLTGDKATALMELKGLSARDKAILEVLYGTGVRASELVGMNIEDADFINETVDVIGKRKKERETPLTKAAVIALQEYLASRVTTRHPHLSPREPLFLNKNSTRLSTRGLQNIVHSHIQKIAELTRMSPHTLRHTYASVLLDKGCDLRTIQELLGHSSISSTQIYTHLTPGKLKDAYKKAHPRA